MTCHIPCNTSNNYWTRLSKISWSSRHWQISHDILRWTSSALVFSFDPQVFSYLNLSDSARKRSTITIFHTTGGYNYACEEHYLLQNTFRQHAWTDHYLYTACVLHFHWLAKGPPRDLQITVICRSRACPLANQWKWSAQAVYKLWSAHACCLNVFCSK